MPRARGSARRRLRPQLRWRRSRRLARASLAHGPPLQPWRSPSRTATVAPRAAPQVRRTVTRTSAATVRPTNAELQLLRVARQDVTRGDFAGALAIIAEHVPRFRNGGVGGRARSLARQVPVRARASRGSAACGGRVPRAVSAQRVPFDLRTHEGGGPLTARAWGSRPLCAARQPC